MKFARTLFQCLLFIIPAVMVLSGCGNVLGNPNVAYYLAGGPPTYSTPVITGINPASGFYQDSVTITGTGFGPEKGDGTILFTGGDSTEKSWSDTQIVAEVPSSGKTGPITITNSAGLSGTSAASFTMLIWDSQSSSTTNDIFGLFFLSSSRGYAVGYDRTIDYVDGTWNYTGLTPNVTLLDIKMVSTTAGWAVGYFNTDGYVYNTTNGTVWNQQNIIAGSPLRGVSFADVNNGWAVGDGGIIRHTLNGGTAWSNQVSPTTQNLRGVSFVDANNGWAVGDNGTIIRTSNGTDWAVEASGTAEPLFSIFMNSTTDGWAVGSNGAVLYYTGGAWNASQVGGAPFKTVFFLNPNQGWIAGAGGVLYYTGDGGVTWTAESTGTAQTINSVFFVTRNEGWAAAYGGTIRYCHVVY
ncbi:MAG: YCF48-related protein [Chloroflexi bacterium]|nr:YCF48-related protein [Chloroflexota bacterium]